MYGGSPYGALIYGDNLELKLTKKE